MADGRPETSHNRRYNSQQSNPQLNRLSSLSYFSNTISEASIHEINNQQAIINQIISKGESIADVRRNAKKESSYEQEQKQSAPPPNNVEAGNLKTFQGRSRINIENARKVAEEILEPQPIKQEFQLSYKKLPFVIKDVANTQAPQVQSQNTNNTKQR